MPDNELEIRFQVVDHGAAPGAAATPKSPSPVTPSSQQPWRFAQAERDAQDRENKLSEAAGRFDKYLSRIEYRMKRMGARMLAGVAVSEIGGEMGFEDSSIGRIGTHVVTGAMMGGAVGAASYGTLAIVSELIRQVKQSIDDNKKLQQKIEDDITKAETEMVEFRIELGVKEKEMEDKNQEAIRQFNKEVIDYTMNSMRFINVPYTGRG